MAEICDFKRNNKKRKDWGKKRELLCEQYKLNLCCNGTRGHCSIASGD